MTPHRSWTVPLLALGLLAGATASAASAAAPAAAKAPAAAAGDEQDATALRQLGDRLAISFALPVALPLDADLRAQAEGIAAEHLARIRPLLAQWLREERRLQASESDKPAPNAVLYAIWARVLNELALWQIEPGDAAYERATLDVVQNAPMMCRVEGDPLHSDYASRILRVQAMAPAQRSAALAQERALLAHWGAPRGAVAPWPEPLPQDAGMAAVARLRAGGARPPLALPPVLASVLLAARGEYAKQPVETKCRFQQWWLRVGLAQGAAPAEALNAFRYGTMITATMRLGEDFERQYGAKTGAATPTDGPRYPRLATWFDVAGTTKIRRRVDAAGKPEQASVVGRSIEVRGIRGVRPVAFEDSFDALSLAYGMKPNVKVSPIDDRTGVFQMVWRLELDTPAPPAGQAKQESTK